MCCRVGPFKRNVSLFTQAEFLENKSADTLFMSKDTHLRARATHTHTDTRKGRVRELGSSQCVALHR